MPYYMETFDKIYDQECHNNNNNNNKVIVVLVLGLFLYVIKYYLFSIK